MTEWNIQAKGLQRESKERVSTLEERRIEASIGRPSLAVLSQAQVGCHPYANHSERVLSRQG